MYPGALAQLERGETPEQEGGVVFADDNDAPDAPPGYAPPLRPGMPPRLIIHEITPETADLLRHGRARYEPPSGWTPPDPPWDPETQEPYLLNGVQHDVASDPRLAAAVALEGSIVDAAWSYAPDAGPPEHERGVRAPAAWILLAALGDPYELARAVAHVAEVGEERDDAPSIAPLEEQLHEGLRLLEEAAKELRAMADRADPAGSLAHRDARPDDEDDDDSDGDDGDEDAAPGAVVADDAAPLPPPDA